jgi:hypothetical protein
MANTVKLPVIGQTDRRWVYVGAAAVAVIVGWAYWRRGRGDDDGLVYDPSTGSPTANSGYVNPNPDPPNAVDPGPGVNHPSNNAEWGQLAVARLVELGENPSAAALAVGKYLGSVALTSVEADMVRRAKAITGDPPKNLPIILLTTTPAPGGGTPAPPPPPPPPPAPAPAPNMGTPTPPRIHHIPTTRTTAEVQWYAGKNAAKYKVYSSGAGLGVRLVATVGGSVRSFKRTGLKPGTRYWFSVRTVNAANISSALSNIVATTTRR